MALFAPLRTLTPLQRRAFIASFLGWTLDAFDFFLVTFVVSRIATDFAMTIPGVLAAVTVMLMFRPLGALIFGTLADRYGRRGPLMASILLYSLFELLTAFSPNFAVFIVLSPPRRAAWRRGSSSKAMRSAICSPPSCSVSS
jgi:SHS family lactate transporter-like MFS transporter